MSDERSKVEVIKEASHYLRGTIAADLKAESDHFDEAGKQILKFHGLYQQDDRDQRKASPGRKKDKGYSFMIRSKIPAGHLTAEQYLVHDDLATRYANNTLRITTRQDFQLHGVLKGDIKAALHKLNESLVTTLGACGDLVRNVACCPVPASDSVRAEIQAVAKQISDHLLPRTKAYHEIWLEGEKVYDGQDQDQEEPIYGKTYLPRKLKIGIAHPGDNCVDVYTQDIGLAPIVEDHTLRGFNVLVGGGMGMTHNKPDTFPRLADPLAFVPPDQVVPVVEQIVLIQRDYGNRSDRKHARLKYLVYEWGVKRFRGELEQRLGYPLQEVAPMSPFELDLHLGWQQQGDGRWYLGLSIENGRIQDAGRMRLKTGLRRIIQTFRPGIRLTPNHDILLTDLPEEHIGAVEALLREYGIQGADDLSNIQLYSMACPALPTCGLALTDAERTLPGVIDQLETEIAQLGLQKEKFSIRMTGCPNGCARPYVADLAFVGRSAHYYTIFVGGKTDGARLNQVYQDLVHEEALVETVRPLLVFYRSARRPGEAFGDFCHRLGVERLQNFSERYQEHVVLPV